MAGSRATHIEIEFFGNGFEHLRFRNSLRKLNVISSALVACVYWSVGWIGWLVDCNCSFFVAAVWLCQATTVVSIAAAPIYSKLVF